MILNIYLGFCNAHILNYCLVVVNSIIQADLNRRTLLSSAFRKHQYDIEAYRKLGFDVFFLLNLNWLSFVQLTESNWFFLSSAENRLYFFLVWRCTCFNASDNKFQFNHTAFDLVYSFQRKRNGENECLMCNVLCSNNKWNSDNECCVLFDTNI